MLCYNQIHDASLKQLIDWWKNPASLTESLNKEEALDEIAFALSKHINGGVETLRCSINASCPDRRRSALYSLAWPDLADDDVRKSLVEAFASTDGRSRSTALWGFIRLDYFPLTANQLSDFLNCAGERLAALAMIYQCRACPDNKVAILRLALQSSNPRKREYACDEIGDHRITDLAAEMRALLRDTDTDVVQAAKCNLQFFDDAAV